MRLQVILDSSFALPGSAPIWGGKKGEFRDWTRGLGVYNRGGGALRWDFTVIGKIFASFLIIGFNAASCFFPWFLKNSKRLWSETNASHAVSSCLLILRYQSPEANLLTVICRPFHEELACSPDKVTCSKLRYAFEQRVPDVDSKSLAFVCDDVCSTAIHLNHGIILSLETNVRNALNRMSSRC